jgi:beta-lactamase regulating signal transducer with metallopeptidase domain
MTMQPLLPWLAERFLNGVPEGIAIALLAWLLLRIFTRSGSSTRFAIWLSALAAIIVIPLARGIWLSKGTLIERTSFWSVSDVWARDICIAWLAVSLLGLVRVALGILNLRRLRRDALRIEISLLSAAVQETLTSLRSSRSVELALSSRVSVPAVIGFFKPIILLPAWALEELSSEQLNAVLMHELAHLRRWDDWTNLAQKLVRALFFFHPAIWWIDHQLSFEREMACDEFVLARTRNPQAYAQCLVSLAEKSLLRRTVAFAQALVGRMGQTTRRVTRILDPHGSVVSRGWKLAFAVLTMASAAGTVWLARAPEFVAFHDSTSSPVVAATSAGHFQIPATVNGHPPMMAAAKFHERSNSLGPIQAVLKQDAPRKHRSPMALNAATHQKQLPEPHVIQASTWPSPSLAPVETVYLVTATQASGSNGTGWTLCVWRITVVNPQVPGSHDLVTHDPQPVLLPSKT